MKTHLCSFSFLHLAQKSILFGNLKKAFQPVPSYIYIYIYTLNLYRNSSVVCNIVRHTMLQLKFKDKKRKSCRKTNLGRISRNVKNLLNNYTF